MLASPTSLLIRMAFMILRHRTNKMSASAFFYADQMNPVCRQRIETKIKETMKHISFSLLSQKTLRFGRQLKTAGAVFVAGFCLSLHAECPCETNTPGDMLLAYNATASNIQPITLAQA